LTLLFPKTAQSANLSAKYGYDEWLVGRFLQYVPDIKDFLAKMEKTPVRYIRVNTLKTSIEELMLRLRSKGFEFKATRIPEVLAVKKASLSLGATTEYLLGHYYIQDLSSCIAVEALDIKQNQIVLDMAAAPGGKTTFMAQKMHNTGIIIAMEPSGRRARSTLFNLARCGVYNTCIFKTNAVQADKLGIKFDRVLLDAPCSCEGVMARDPTRKRSHKPEDVDYCSKIQENLIESAVSRVKPGGILVYSTCSFAPEENEMVVDRVLKDWGSVRVEPIPYGINGLIKFGDLSFGNAMMNTRRLYPHLHNTTGFFIARLRIN
ncbi:MAG: RsmB/NOP family class I SAM-dependent RNA methyltransferase, partial [Thermoproteota archaeon]|nr:RsmB/NOP family class I SAM-dependent RNA methyltransferase [Thermoproteota archaeon]